MNSSIQRWRASNTYTETEWALLMASASRRRAFSRGAFALVVADLDGAFFALYQKAQDGDTVAAFKVITTGVASLPAAPADVLLSAATPNTNVRLGVGGVGAAISDAALLALLVTAGAVDLTTAQALSNKTLTDPKISTALHAANGTKVVGINAVATPDAWVDLTAGNAPGTPPSVTANGADVDVSLAIAPKGSGLVRIVRPYFDEVLDQASVRRLGFPFAADSDQNITIATGEDGVGSPEISVEGVGAAIDFIRPSRMVVESGTVAQITGGVGVFASPVIGQMAFATDSAPGPHPCWYSGTQWVHASGLPI